MSSSPQVIMRARANWGAGCIYRLPTVSKGSSEDSRTLVTPHAFGLLPLGHYYEAQRAAYRRKVGEQRDGRLG